MPTNEARRKLTSCGMFILPLVLVKATGIMLGGGGPAASEAAPRPAIPPIVFQPETPPEAPSDAVLAVAGYVSALHDRPFGPTPLYYGTRDDGPVAPETTPQLDPVPEFTVQAVMASAMGNVALIDGRARRVGDKLRDTGWTIVLIDAETRSVTIEDPQTQRRETRSVRTP